MEDLFKMFDKMSEQYGPRYYDKYGKPLKLLEWAKLLEKPGYKRIDHTKLWWGGFVSTIWLGVNHGWGSGPPLCFETMVFGWRKWNSPSFHSDFDQVRYSDLAEARNGHIAMVKKWQNPLRLFKPEGTVMTKKQVILSIINGGVIGGILGTLGVKVWVSWEFYVLLIWSVFFSQYWRKK